jgi:ABC transporter with metal-binding/Fe-S-binding domain ATP-binding protein
MKLAAFFSGGKDSCYAIYKAKKLGHTIEALITIIPYSDESNLLHYDNITKTKAQSESMNISHIIGKAVSTKTIDEISLLHKLISEAKNNFQIDGIVHGGILSEFQKSKFESICDDLKLKLISPLWHENASIYMKNLLDDNFEFIICSVTTNGLDDRWLGKKITYADLEILEKLSKKFQFNLNFEGGEAETFVLNCPIFNNPLKIIEFKKKWDGYRGRFEIVDVGLVNNVR